VAVLKKLADLFIFTNLFVAFAVACLTFESQLLIRGYIDIEYVAFVFFSTLFLYNFHRVFRLKHRSAEEQEERRHKWVREHRTLTIFILCISLAGTAYCAFFVQPIIIILLAPFGLIAFAYSLPFIPYGEKKLRLRDVPMLKIFLISLVLAVVTVLLPSLTWFKIGEHVLMDYRPGGTMFIRRMLFIFAITIPFDIRDMVHDKKSRLMTIPLLAGERAAKGIALFALLGFVFLLCMEWSRGILAQPYLYALIASVVLSGAAIVFSSNKRNEYYYVFFVEGSMIVQAGLVYAAYLSLR
jgi:4-hydroxybenzoate polyprenyltransferase